MTLFVIFAFIIGAIIGSFVNVVAMRYNTGSSFVAGRSRCPNCNVPLKWYELIPVLSFVFSGGKCLSCGSKISWQYPLIEISSGIIFVLLFLRQAALLSFYGMAYSWIFFVYYAFVFSLLLVILLYDFHHKIIPNSLVYVFAFLAVLKLALFFYIRPPLGALDYVDLLSPVILFAFIFILWFVSRGRWIGLGDAKLAFGIGALLGFVLGISGLVLAFWIGAVFGIVYLIFKKSSGASGQSQIPFAPFLIVATFIVFFTHIDVLRLGAFLNYL